MNFWFLPTDGVVNLNVTEESVDSVTVAVNSLPVAPYETDGLEPKYCPDKNNQPAVFRSGLMVGKSMDDNPVLPDFVRKDVAAMTGPLYEIVPASLV
jgi:hypothetical protein